MANYLEPDNQLRLEAQQRLSHKNLWGMPAVDMDQRRLVHELQVHQIELEIQNEELTQTLTEGNIVELNLRATKMLGQERKSLVGRPLREFFDPQALPRPARLSTPKAGTDRSAW